MGRVNRRFARVLTVSDPLGAVGEVVSSSTMNADPFPVLVSQPEGSTTELTVVSAKFNHVKAGSIVTITKGADTQVGTVAENLTFKKGDELKELTTLVLESAITVPAGGYDKQRATIAPQPPASDSISEYILLDDADSLTLDNTPLNRDNGKPRFRVNAGALEETDDVRDMMTIEGPSNASGRQVVGTHPTDTYLVTFTVKRLNGTTNTNANRPKWEFIDGSGKSYIIPIVSGVGTHEVSLANPRKIKFAGSEHYRVADPLVLVIAES